MPAVYTVSQVNRHIKQLFGEDPALRMLSVQGEVSNLKYHSAGHIYFTLKDAESAIMCVMFARKRAAGLRFLMENGQKIVVDGSVDVYTRSGYYQLYADRISLAGQGNLFLQFEALKKKLSSEGLFDPSGKKPLPSYARTVGIVTSETGAVIEDIRKVAGRRNPYVQLILCPARVQGQGAAESVARGIKRLDRMGLDVLIVGRGGGSIEDLWAFNEEIVARAIYACQTPVIAAVGHGTDTTIADFVADRSAPTPSAAAELAVFDVMQFDALRAEKRETLTRALERRIETYRYYFHQAELKLALHSPQRELDSRRQTLAEAQERMQTALLHRTGFYRQQRDNIAGRLEKAIRDALKSRKNRLALLAGQLDGRSPLKKISGGFGFLTDGENRRIAHISDVRPGDEMHVRIQDGHISARVEETEKTEIWSAQQAGGEE